MVTRIHIFDRSIEIINPRRSIGFAPSALKAIRYGVPQRLNPQIAALFASPAYGLQLPAGGLPMLLRESRLFSGRKSDMRVIRFDRLPRAPEGQEAQAAVDSDA